MPAASDVHMVVHGETLAMMDGSVSGGGERGGQRWSVTRTKMLVMVMAGIMVGNADDIVAWVILVVHLTHWLR
jgi:hypothetical protein